MNIKHLPIPELNIKHLPIPELNIKHLPIPELNIKHIPIHIQNVKHLLIHNLSTQIRIKLLMEDPVIASDGHYYERQLIEHWLKEHDTSPVTREKMEKQLMPDKVLRNRIKKYRKLHPERKNG
ncbi:MAG: hypothetical protein EZS28_005879 [Streblomastix strix]|uniref:U-box domain-containing protein n=1 Tax=Streblomastix strix TaxID=222440 RepID=A0A5J4WU94_9EUKA|nr:MAG: hypothetical protein EZS28_005879 [Streblomastix strix]